MVLVFWPGYPGYITIFKKTTGAYWSSVWLGKEWRPWGLAHTFYNSLFSGELIPSYSNARRNMNPFMRTLQTEPFTYLPGNPITYGSHHLNITTPRPCLWSSNLCGTMLTVPQTQSPFISDLDQMHVPFSMDLGIVPRTPVHIQT